MPESQELFAGLEKSLVFFQSGGTIPLHFSELW